MKTLKPAIALTLALAAGQAQANTITADGAFEVVYYGDSSQRSIALPYEGSGSFSLRENRISDFEFTMLGFTWTEDDLDPRRCTPGFCTIFDVDGHGTEIRLDQLGFHFSNADGEGTLRWDFPHGNFAIHFNAGDYAFTGTTEDVQAGWRFDPYLDYRINIPEPDTLTLLALGLILLWFGSRTESGKAQ